MIIVIIIIVIIIIIITTCMVIIVKISITQVFSSLLFLLSLSCSTTDQTDFIACNAISEWIAVHVELSAP